MEPAALQMWRWLAFACFSWTCLGQVASVPYYIVTIPAVLEAGAGSRFCLSLLRPNETLQMTVTLMSEDENITLFQQTSDKQFRQCILFKVPKVQNSVQELEVILQGQDFVMKEVRKVMIKSYNPQTFIQTDKPIYLPGQTVHFRVITLDSKLRSVNELYKEILIKYGTNRIGQWLNQAPNGTLLQLSYKLNSEAPVGTYRIEVWNVDDEVQFSQSFEVEKYVLPKFDVKVTAPKEMSVAQEDITAEVCSTYTYKQPVPGTASMHVCRPLDHYVMIPVRSSPNHPEGEPEFVVPCHKETKQLDKTGCATFNFNMALFTRVEKLVRTELSVTAEVEEEGTGLNYLGSETIQLSYVIGKLSFVDTPEVYKKGSVVEGKVKAVYFNNTPIPDMLLHLFEGERWSEKLLSQNLTTDSDGFASFLFDTSRYPADFQFTVSALPIYQEYQGYRTPHYEDGEHTFMLFRLKTKDTPTISSLEVKKRETKLVCNVEELINVRFAFVGEAPGPVDIMYLILARGAISRQGLMKVEVLDEPVTKGEVSIKLEVSPDMAPLVQVVVYAGLPSENVIAHKADFDTEKCFATKVSLEFSPSTAIPGEENRLQLRANPGSLCGITAVDQSVLIKEPGKKLTADKIFNLLPVQRASMYPYEVNDPEACLRVRSKRSILPYPVHDDSNAYSVFEGVGLKMLTNLVLKSPSCVTYNGVNYYHQRMVTYRMNSYPMAVAMNRMDAHGGSHPQPQIIETVRTFFPETWLWDIVEVGKSGLEEVHVTVPDTITTWETEAFCLSEQGFGLASPKELVVFQPFFLDLSLPYSIIRGENLELKATVFNYQSSCIMVSVSPLISSDYTLTPLAGAQQASCLCAKGRRTHSWKLTPTALGPVNVTMIAEAVGSHTSCDNEIVNVPERGRIDVVTRSLIVKAEGTEQTKTHNILLCPKGESLQEQVELSLPEDVIQGSARASVSVLGDILGRALKNLDGLLSMPYGCGEQNMALLAPNIYILEYLTNTQQITSKIKARATNFLTSGYQRQLNYKHSDGAYSTFGTGSGNTWLTAFVLRSFVKAKSFIYIDPTILADAQSWLESKQQDNGCFQKLGSLFNNRMKGGVSDEVTLSAYVTAALLETNMSVSDPQINKSMSCLRQSLGDKSNTYATALLAYVFTLVGDMEARTLLLEHLDKVATQEGGNLYWSPRSEKSMSLSVEISSYVLLATLSATPTTADLGYASRIVRWLTSQQNSYGGFSSTQDTVVALQALALYSTLVFSPEGSSTVDIQLPSGQMTFEVNQDNKLLYQERSMKDVTGKYSVVVKGTACASMQLSLHYNIPTPRDESSFRIKVTPDSECSTNQLRPKVTLRLESKYVGKEDSTNMVMVDIKLLSGFVPEPESLRKLKSALLVDRVEHNDDHVIIYLKPFLAVDVPINHFLDILQDIEVENLKPAVVKIYDYYQQSDQAETEYNDPCNKKLRIADE
ncbi:alpha-2-macroglobulin-like [Gadus macrocephalus]|uniref:alpha-2-macroglobulin-like n=1 Tax=Gadus macrocephalus TaxID=80720 RepID=UPI0028CB9FB7|nr:alpha-2-macroglobulin-like [Gadus macrocephalus]